MVGQALVEKCLERVLEGNPVLIGWISAEAGYSKVPVVTGGLRLVKYMKLGSMLMAVVQVARIVVVSVGVRKVTVTLVNLT